MTLYLHSLNGLRDPNIYHSSIRFYYEYIATIEFMHVETKSTSF